MKTKQDEVKPAEVSKTKQAGEAATEWSWVERAVWTERMLKALVTGVKGGVWFSLMDKVYSLKNLQAAFEKVKKSKGKAAGVDHVTKEHFGERLEENLSRLTKELREGTYRPQSIRRRWIDKPGQREKRPLGIPTLRDKVVQRAVLNVIEPIFEQDFAAESYGFRPGRGCKDALRQVNKALENGRYWVVDADIRSYFDQIDHDRLMQLIEQQVADGAVLELLRSFLRQNILEDLKSWTPEDGCPQGAVISPLLANIFLNPLDHEMEQRGHLTVRYADDLVVLCKSEQEAREVLNLLQRWVESVGLQLHSDKTRIVDLHEDGFDFLGYHFRASKKGLPHIVKWPRTKSMKKLRANLKPLTKRANGRSLEALIQLLNPKLRGWFEYYKHSRPHTFPGVDGWVRGRLRGILRKRKGLRGRGRGIDHQRWPNAFFHDRGLFSCTAAHASAIRSSSR